MSVAMFGAMTKPVDEMTLEELFEGVTPEQARALAEAYDVEERLFSSPDRTWLKTRPMSDAEADPGAGLPHLTEEQEALVLRCTVPAVQELLRARRELLRQLRSDGWTLQQLATLMRTSRQRVHQLLVVRGE